MQVYSMIFVIDIRYKKVCHTDRQTWRHTKALLWHCCGVAMRWYGVAMPLLCSCYGVAMALLLRCYGIAMALLWRCYGVAMALLRRC